MKIEKLIIKNYKLFNDIAIEMNSDVNIFVGENDSGKTTIFRGIINCFDRQIEWWCNYNKIKSRLV